MTKTEVLKKFFKKFFDIDAHGWGTVSVLNDVIENNESLDGGGSSGSGSSGGIMMVNVDNDTNMLDKTWQEIYDHINGGGMAFRKSYNSLGGGVFVLPLSGVYSNIIDGGYTVAFGVPSDGTSVFEYSTGSTDGYPGLLNIDPAM